MAVPETVAAATRLSIPELDPFNPSEALLTAPFTPRPPPIVRAPVVTEVDGVAGRICIWVEEMFATAVLLAWI